MIDDGKINYRAFSSSGGISDYTIDFAKDAQTQLGLMSYRAK
ncbi:hypothetical protein [Streptomyces luteolus]|uniref:Uncharacterized protein n=1 Tax=Streptomyces luteolus TaxID=3043615 RepID=A0ABT6TAG9_9ACTN|nr:hypothetical protein [Streptomyces sp. B-S-A12]MDI3424358.1 hypothetical protein [Streptomyces sp. B-S-A12]